MRPLKHQNFIWYLIVLMSLVPLSWSLRKIWENYNFINGSQIIKGQVISVGHYGGRHSPGREIVVQFNTDKKSLQLLFNGMRREISSGDEVSAYYNKNYEYLLETSFFFLFGSSFIPLAFGIAMLWFAMRSIKENLNTNYILDKGIKVDALILGCLPFGIDRNKRTVFYDIEWVHPLTQEKSVRNKMATSFEVDEVFPKRNETIPIYIDPKDAKNIVLPSYGKK